MVANVRVIGLMMKRVHEDAEMEPERSYRNMDTDGRMSARTERLSHVFSNKSSDEDGRGGGGNQTAK